MELARGDNDIDIDITCQLMLLFEVVREFATLSASHWSETTTPPPSKCVILSIHSNLNFCEQSKLERIFECTDLGRRCFGDLQKILQSNKYNLCAILLSLFKHLCAIPTKPLVSSSIAWNLQSKKDKGYSCFQRSRAT
jgi:hypothetical protein